jgi:hypothetical protein
MGTASLEYPGRGFEGGYYHGSEKDSAASRC